MSDIPENFKEYYKGIEYRLDSLEKKLEEDIESRKNWEDAWVKVSNSYLKWYDEFKEQKEQIAELKELESDGRAEWKNRIHRLEEILRDSIDFSNLLLELFLNADIIDEDNHYRAYKEIKNMKEKLDATEDRQPGGTGKKDSGGEKDSDSLKIGLQNVGKHPIEKTGVMGSNPIHDSKLPEPKRECATCFYENLNLNSIFCNNCALTKPRGTLPDWKPKEKTKLTKKTLDSEPSFICKKCGEGVYINNYKFKGSYYCVDCMPKEVASEITAYSFEYINGSGEHIKVSNLVDKNELIEEFLDDLCKPLPLDILKLRIKWRGRVK